MAISPLDAAHRLRSAAVDGRLEDLADLHALSLVVMFGSASRGQPDARDLDIAVGARARTGLDVLAVICALMDLVDSDRVDLLDLDRAGPVARQHALVPGEPLYEYRSGEFARQQMRASGQRLGTEWMRRLDLALMAGRP
ncbi:MAG: nucleotidyltransferase domain-containing protein [Actinomycetota bacterium]|nr:nucleotidyltransferase domain-containing protein [Actinomycetota bacterium]